jgi:DNA-binding CsgD family transcriptional regulator
MGFYDASSSSSEAAKVVEYGMIGAIAGWCEALHGKSPLGRGLQLIGSGVEAEAISVVRYSLSGGADGRPLIWDRAPAEVRGGRLQSGFARSLMGSYFDSARPGSLWFRSMLDDVAHDLRDFQTARALRELVIVPLEVGPRFVDTIEMHFNERLRPFQQHLLTNLAPVLSQTWKNREQCLFTEEVLRRSEQQRSGLNDTPILSTANPARLSRAEYRVGLMLSRGLSPEEVRASLCIQDSTLRTHLGNLYAKTCATNLSELVYLLVSAAPHQRDLGAAKVRRA